MTIFKNGKQVYDLPSTDEIRLYCAEQIKLRWDEVKRFENPHKYYVDLSQKLWDIKHQMINKSTVCISFTVHAILKMKNDTNFKLKAKKKAVPLMTKVKVRNAGSCYLERSCEVRKSYATDNLILKQQK